MLRPGSAQICEAAGVDGGRWGLRVFLRLSRRYTYVEPALSRIAGHLDQQTELRDLHQQLRPHNQRVP